jgi:hypothetical protein
MSESRVCCNCRYNIIITENCGKRHYCKIRDKFMGYFEVIEGSCCKWESDKKKSEVNADDGCNN